MSWKQLESSLSSGPRRSRGPHNISTLFKARLSVLGPRQGELHMCHRDSDKGHPWADLQSFHQLSWQNSQIPRMPRQRNCSAQSTWRAGGCVRRLCCIGLPWHLSTCICRRGTQILRRSSRTMCTTSAAFWTAPCFTFVGWLAARE